MSEHTKTPWRVTTESAMLATPEPLGLSIMGAGNSYVCSLRLDQRETAERIVSCVNHYDKMLEALKKAEAQIRALSPNGYIAPALGIVHATIAEVEASK